MERSFNLWGELTDHILLKVNFWLQAISVFFQRIIAAFLLCFFRNWIQCSERHQLHTILRGGCSFSVQQGGCSPARWDRQFAVFYHKCSKSKGGLIPELTRQDMSIEIVSLYIPFWFMCIEDRAQCSEKEEEERTCFQVLNGEFSETR